MSAPPKITAIQLIEDMFNCGSATTIRVCEKSCRCMKLRRLSGRSCKEVSLILQMIP